MIDSVRGRLALWHTSVLAALLVTFASLSYGLLSRTITRRTDAYLEESAGALADDLHADDITDAADSTGAQETLAEFHLRDLGFLVFDAHGRLVASDLPADSASGDHRAGAVVDFAAVRAALGPDLVAGGPRFATLPNGRGGSGSMRPARTGRRASSSSSPRRRSTTRSRCSPRCAPATSSRS